ncbi:transcription elongation factor GreA [Motilibacter peucedani]|uniref:Transcription elongation factor GreA n=1 Tax=Motilibacter peucedani TaxID=598650 RepID=A0A420XV35_9ACTN|nr:transcription elongation factor GreA [Motilibacter peucedani]RKS80705.1 transcription elongation factor GreA [Motilibacter peucedani]
MSETSAQTAWLTQEQFDRLTAELEHLRGPARAEIVKRIEAAREEGDLKENGGYHAAKDEQGKQEARIRQLTQLLENSRIGVAAAPEGVVAPGMVVTAEVAGDVETFLLGSREGISGDIDVYSPTSPLGAAIVGQHVGTTTSYTAPNGREITVVVKDVKPYAG